MQRDLESFFHPKGVAVIGASNSPEKVGAIVLRNILDSGYKGRVYPVNPKGGMIGKLMAAEKIADLPLGVELAVVATPASTVLTILTELGQKGVQNVIVFSAGFSEMGTEGKLLQFEMKEVIKRYGLNVLGPNCLGFLSMVTPINATFGQQLTEKGNLLLISQSGAIAASIFDWSQACGVGIANAITLGNKADLDENEILRYFLATNHEAVPYRAGMAHAMPIGMYLESIHDGTEFIKLCGQLSRKHPLFLLKPGKSIGAKQAMQSHTGAIAGEDFVLEAALQEAGVIRANGMEDFFDFCRAFSFEDVPKGPRVAVISNAGGPAVISADLIDEYGLKLADISPQTNKILEKYLPRAASLLNPIDVLGDALADRFNRALSAVLAEKGVDGVVMILTPQVMTEIEATAEVIGRLSFEYKKPILAAFIGGTRVAMGERVLNRYKIPVFRYPERAILAMAKLWEWAGIKSRPEKAMMPISTPVNRKETKLTNLAEISRVLTEYGIGFPSTKKVETLSEAKAFWQKYRSGSVVLKIWDEKLLHKKEFGAVELNIGTYSQLTAAWKRLVMANRQVAKAIGRRGEIYAQVQVDPGIELIAGVKRDTAFGQVLMFGAGGALAELISDRNLKLLPVGRREALKLIKQAKIYPLLAGYRGEKGYDVEGLAKTLAQFAKMSMELLPYGEIEINPLLVNRRGIWAVDIKIINN